MRALAEALVTSMNYDNTRNLWAAIARQEQWESESLNRIRYAVETNSQVYNANVDGTLAPALVDELVARFDPKPSRSGSDVTF